MPADHLQVKKEIWSYLISTLYFSFNIVLQFLCLPFSRNVAPDNFWQRLRHRQ